MNVEKIFSAPKATEKQIREHYKSLGYECRISDGHVRFRSASDTWRDGRWVADYLAIDGKVVLV
jgi:hypothetical protein